MPTSWIYKLNKEELTEESRNRGLSTQDQTVENLRRNLSDFIKSEKVNLKGNKKTSDQPGTSGDDELQETGIIKSQSDYQTRMSQAGKEQNPKEDSMPNNNAGQRMKKILQTVQNLNVSFDTKDDSIEFLERLKEVAQICDEDVNHLVQVLPFCLRGDALLWYRNNNTTWKTWEEFREDFKLYFVPRNYEENLMGKIIAKKQTFRETFVEYLNGIHTLIRRYGKMTETEKLERIYENMNPKYKFYIKRQEFAALKELILLATEYEQIARERYMERTFGREVQPGTSSQQYTSKYDERTNKKQVENLERKQKYMRNYDPEKCCWNCGRTGHSYKECRNNKIIFCWKCGKIGTMSRDCCRLNSTRTPIKASTAKEETSKDNRIFMEIKIEGNPYKALVDTGSTRSYITSNIYYRCVNATTRVEMENKEITMADGSITDSKKALNLNIEIEEEKSKRIMYVLPGASEAIIGMDILKEIGMEIKWGKNSGKKQTAESRHTSETMKTEEKKNPPEDCLLINERQQLEKLLEIEFEKSDSSPKGNTWVEHKIKLKHNEPVKQKYYPRNPKLQAKIDEHVDKMLEEDVIEESSSPYSSPVVLARKDNGEYRFCIDFRKINEISEKDAYPLPQIDDTLEKLKKGNYFSKFDLKDGYWNVKLSEDSKPATAFTVPGRGLYQFRVMPFGLHSSGATFQRLLDKVIGPAMEPHAYVYLDDIILCSATFEEHLQHLREIFKRIREAGLRINKKKCEFGKPEVEYLGHRVTKDGIKMNEGKIEAIKGLKAPENIKDLRRFMGMTSWYRKFIPKYSEIMSPMIELLKKDKKFSWSKEQENAFQRIKEIVSEDPVLAKVNFSEAFILKTDASDVGLGAVLMQEVDGVERAIMYASRSLLPAETRYTTSEKECLAVVWGIRKMRAFLEGYYFTVVTDHQALKWLNSVKNPSGRLARWALELQQYDFEIKYNNGKQNVVADELSRNPVYATDSEEGDWYKKKLREINRNPEENEDYRIQENKLYKKITNTAYGVKLNPESEWKLCAPKQERDTILRENHDEPKAGHLGTSKTLTRVAQRYYWPGMFRDVAKYVRKCITCQTHKPSQERRPGLMHIRNAEQPWEIVSTDLIGPLPRSSQGYNWIIVFHDKFSKWTEIRPLRTATSNTVSKALKECIIMRYGCPKALLTDNGKQFTSKQFENELQKYGIDHRLTAPYTPQSNPTERVNRTLETMIATYVSTNHKKWDEYLSELNFAINTSKQESTRYTPAFLLFGRELRIPGDKNRLPTPSIRDKEKTEELYELVRTYQNKASTHQKHHYDKQRREWGPRINDLVLKRDFPLSDASKSFCAKLAPKYIGPYKIIEQKSPVIYVLQDQSNTRKTRTAHVKDLKEFIQ